MVEGVGGLLRSLSSFLSRHQPDSTPCKMRVIKDEKHTTGEMGRGLL